MGNRRYSRPTNFQKKRQLEDLILIIIYIGTIISLFFPYYLNTRNDESIIFIRWNDSGNFFELYDTFTLILIVVWIIIGILIYFIIYYENEKLWSGLIIGYSIFILYGLSYNLGSIGIGDYIGLFGLYLNSGISIFGLLISIMYLKRDLKNISNLTQIILDQAYTNKKILLSDLAIALPMKDRKIKKIIQKLIETRQLMGRFDEMKRTINIPNPIGLISSKSEDGFLTKKKQIIGMIKAHGKLHISESAQILNIPVQKLKALLYELLADDKISGTIENDHFLITTDINEFINLLDSQFSEWEKVESNKFGKKT